MNDPGYESYSKMRAGIAYSKCTEYVVSCIEIDDGYDQVVLNSKHFIALQVIKVCT